MSDVRAITTCNAAGWALYGRRMAGSWAQHWPVPLTVWAEGFDIDVRGVAEAHDLRAVGWLAEFKARHRSRPTENYRMDAVRFAHKTAAVIESALSFDCGRLIWVDADTVTHSPVPPRFVEQLLPRGDEYIAWLDRAGNYPECGLYVINLEHPRHRELMERWRHWYMADEVFELPEWHDSYVLQQLVERAAVQTKSLSGPRARMTSHPFINGPLGAYMDHMKGQRKRAGKSNRRDLKIARAEPYWRTLR